MPLTFPVGVRWDWLLFTATTTAFVAHMYYNSDDALLSRSKKSRLSRSMKQVSFRLDSTTTTTGETQESGKNQMVHSSITDLLPSIKFDTLSSSPPKVVGLLFAAKWCPDCTNVVPAIGKVMAAVPTATKSTADRDWLQVIYVSSDIDEISIQQFKPMNLLHIPHSAVNERTNIKRHYSTCAAKEMKSLQISSRKHGIPTLLLLNAVTGSVLSENAVNDVMDPSTTDQQVLDQWKRLLVSD